MTCDRRTIRWRKGTILVAAALAAGGMVFLATRDLEPAYDGRSLTVWLGLLDQKSHDSAVFAIRQIGTNGLPHLVRLLRARDGWLKKKLLSIPELHSLPIRYEHDKRLLAIAGLKILGASAAPAIPEIARLLSQDHDPISMAQALVLIGPQSIPPMVAALTNANPEIRTAVVSALIWMEDDERTNALPALIHHLRDPDPVVRYTCAIVLGRWKAAPEIAVPALILSLEDADPMVRALSVKSLGEFGPAARAARSDLEAMTRRADVKLARRFSLHDYVYAALKRIDAAPEGSISPHPAE